MTTEWTTPRILALQSHTNWREKDGHTPSDRALYAKYLHQKGYSASQVATALGGNITRNAVIGILHRLGWAHEAREKYNRPAKRRVRKIKPVSQVKVVPKREFRTNGNPAVRALFKDEDMQPIRKSFDEVGFGTSKALVDLTDKDCKWPLGALMEASTRFCGCKAVPGLSWCPDHARSVYQPVQSKRAYVPRVSAAAQTYSFDPASHQGFDARIPGSRVGKPANRPRMVADAQNGSGGDVGSQNVATALKTALEGAE